MTAFAKELGESVLANGYRICLIGPSKKHPFYKGWQNGADQSEAEQQAWLKKSLANGHANDGLGILTKYTPFVDADVRNVVFLRWLRDWIVINLGFAPCRIGNAPKRGFLFRLGGPPFRKLSTPVFIDPEGNKAQVEILADGQQFVSAHIHPDTSKPYRWIGNDKPETMPVSDLPELTAEAARKLIAASVAWMTKAGWARKSPEQQERPEFVDEVSDDVDLDPRNTEPMGLSLEQVSWYVSRIPNLDADYEGWGLTWFNVLAAIHHETAGSDEGKHIALEWSEKSPKHDLEPGRFDKTWRSLSEAGDRYPVTFRAIVKFAKDSDKRPKIYVEAGELARTADEAEAALVAAGAPIYVRSNGLVRPVVETAKAARGATTRVARLTQMTEHGLTDHLSIAAKFERFDARAKQRVIIDAPPKVCSVILSRDGVWKFRPIAGVITTPTLREDGSILMTEGYDPQTRLVLLRPPPMPEIPTKPTIDQARKAAKFLETPFVNFPFVDVESRAVALSGLMSPVLRGALPVVPLHLFRAPVPGSGKSLLVNCIAITATGQLAPVTAAGASEEETEKRLSAAVVQGDVLISVDNVTGGRLRGEFLCQLVEQERPQVRILGKTERVSIESRTTVMATGNNVWVEGDMLRRTIVCTLDPRMERPELREFSFDPIRLITADRGKFIAAILTICRWYIEAGMPDALRPLASFGDWSNLVRSPLVALGYADPVATIEKAREEDPTLNALKKFLATWQKEIGLGPRHKKTAAEIFAMARHPVFDDDEPSGFAEALADVAADSHRLGMWLRRNRNRIVDGLKLGSIEDKKRKIMIWYVDAAYWPRASL